jgi:hypothetical protein
MSVLITKTNQLILFYTIVALYSNRALRRVIRPKRDEMTGRWKILHNFFFPLAVQPSWALAAYQSPDLSQLVGLLGCVISPLQGRYLNTGQHKHRINTYTTH